MRIELTNYDGKKVLVRTSEIDKVTEIDEGCIVTYMSGNMRPYKESFRQISDMLHYIEGSKS